MNNVTGSDEVAFVERKGIGHPDSIADLIAEETMSRYRQYIYDRLGIIPNGWFDKVVVSGGEAEVMFGAATVIKKPKVILYGKAMKINGTTDYMFDLFSGAVEHIINSVFGLSTFELVDIELAVNSGMGAEHAKDFYDVTTSSKLSAYFSQDTQKANDTVITSGWWPLNISEKTVITLENYIDSDEFKKLYPETGYDVKVVTVFMDQRYEFTICVPFIAALTPTREVYEQRKKEIIITLSRFIEQEIRINNFVINLNTKDNEKSAYLTVFGSAFDKGDVGVTGRGNRYPGVISILRPSGVEAYSGKNTFNHSGKLYTFLATDIAKAIHEYTRKNIQVIVSTDNGMLIGNPKNIVIFEDGILVNSSLFSSQIQASMDRMKVLGSQLKQDTALADFRSCYGFFESSQ